MKCPICDIDLSPLDLQSRSEHVDVCIENGPSVVEVSESGQLIVKKNAAKQRKICPVCSKTFQTITAHFKTCATKNDVPPGLMLEYWDNINKDTKKSKQFPLELLQTFIARCVKDGRVGEQLDFARALLLSMGGTELSPDQIATNTAPRQPVRSNANQELSRNDITDDTIGGATGPADVSTRLVSAPAAPQPPPTRRTKQNQLVKTRLELADDVTRQGNIALRIDRELAASRCWRYEQSIRCSRRNKHTRGAQDNKDDVECIDNTEGQISEFVIDENDDDVILVEEEPATMTTTVELSYLFFMARLKGCTSSEVCRGLECTEHQLQLTIEGLESYVASESCSGEQQTTVVGEAIGETSSSTADTRSGGEPDANHDSGCAEQTGAETSASML